MGHCWEIPSALPDQMSMLTILENWVENGISPNSILINKYKRMFIRCYRYHIINISFFIYFYNCYPNFFTSPFSKFQKCIFVSCLNFGRFDRKKTLKNHENYFRDDFLKTINHLDTLAKHREPGTFSGTDRARGHEPDRARFRDQQHRRGHGR